MIEILVEALKGIANIVKNHSTRIEALEREEFVENPSEAIELEQVISLLEQVTSLLAEQKTPKSAESVPSDQM